jgi:hypothetical protein
VRNKFVLFLLLTTSVECLRSRGGSNAEGGLRFANPPYASFLTTKLKRKSTGAKKRSRALALKVIHCVDGTSEARRADIVHQLQADVARYTAVEIDQMLKLLHGAKLIRSQQGPYARVQIA